MPPLSDKELIAKFREALVEWNVDGFIRIITISEFRFSDGSFTSKRDLTTRRWVQPFTW
jgi:hypothetical protein